MAHPPTAWGNSGLSSKRGTITVSAWLFAGHVELAREADTRSSDA